MCKKESKFLLYFKEIFNKFSVFLAPFVAATLFTVFYMLQYYDFWENLLNASPKVFYYFIGTVIFISLFISSIVSIRIKHKNVSFLDVFLLGTILFLVSYTIYLLCTVGLKFWIIYLIFLSVLILLIAIVTLRIVFFEEFEVVNTVYTITNLKTYILGTLKKYSSLPIILISIFAIIAFYYVLKHNLFENYLSLKEVNKPIYYASFIMVAIFTLYASIDCSRKKICFLDLLFIALALATPAIWCQLIIFGALTHNLIVCIVLTVFVVFFMAIRVLNTDLLFEEKSKTTHKIGNVSYGLKAYYKEIFSKFSFMSALTLASTIIFLILCAYRFGILDISNPYYSIYIYYAVSGILLFATVIAFICTIFTLITCKSYKVLFTDYVLFVLFLISLICLVLALVSNLSYFVLASAICSAYCLTLSNTRIRHVKIYDGVEK